MKLYLFFFFSSRRRHTRFSRDWSSDVCSSDLRQLGEDRIVALGIVAGRPRPELRLDAAGPVLDRPPLGHRPIPLLELGAQLARPLAGAPALVEQGVPCRFRLAQLGRAQGELLHPPLEEVSVDGDVFELAVEKGEHRRVLRAERALARRAAALRAKPDDQIALLLHLPVLLPQRQPLGLRVLAVAHPRRPLLLHRPLDRRDLLVHCLHRALQGRERRRRRRELRDPALERRDGPRQLLELPLVLAAGRLLPLQPLELAALALESLDRLELRAELHQLLARSEGVRHLTVQPLALLRRDRDGLLRHPAITAERADALLLLHPLLPARLVLPVFRLGRRPGALGGIRRPPQGIEPRPRGRALGGERRAVREPRLESPQLGGELALALPHALLRDPQPVVPQNLRQERRPLGP